MIRFLSRYDERLANQFSLLQCINLKNLEKINETPQNAGFLKPITTFDY